MSSAGLKLPDGRVLDIDEKGYLTQARDWSEPVSRVMAQQDGIDLTEDHWVVIRLMREYFSKYDIEPPMRALVKLTREALGEEKGQSRYLYRLFPEGPGTQGCRYAGLPRPVSCI